MPHISALKQSKFIKKEDCIPKPLLLTIINCTEENVAPEGKEEEYKWCLHFKEIDKPLVLNPTNGEIIAKFTGKENTDDWIGIKIVLFHDPNVSFGGKLIGGVRARAPKGPAQAPVPTNAPAAVTTSPEDPGQDGDDVPF